MAQKTVTMKTVKYETMMSRLRRKAAKNGERIVTNRNKLEWSPYMIVDVTTNCGVVEKISFTGLVSYYDALQPGEELADA